jgi:hypothetical protein
MSFTVLIDNVYCSESINPNWRFMSSVDKVYKQLDLLLNRIYVSPNISDNKKNEIRSEFKTFIRLANKECHDNVCMYRRLTKKKHALSIYYQHIK